MPRSCRVVCGRPRGIRPWNHPGPLALILHLFQPVETASRSRCFALPCKIVVKPTATEAVPDIRLKRGDKRDFPALYLARKVGSAPMATVDKVQAKSSTPVALCVRSVGVARAFKGRAADGVFFSDHSSSPFWLPQNTGSHFQHATRPIGAFHDTISTGCLHRSHCSSSILVNSCAFHSSPSDRSFRGTADNHWFWYKVRYRVASRLAVCGSVDSRIATRAFSQGGWFVALELWL